MSGDAADLIHSLIETVKAKGIVEIREVSPSSDFLEGVLARDDLASCVEALQSAFGSPLKDFDQPVNLERPVKKAISSIGGIRADQCLFVSGDATQQSVYAVLWPWESNPKRITLKIGIFK